MISPPASARKRHTAQQYYQRVVVAACVAFAAAGVADVVARELRRPVYPVSGRVQFGGITPTGAQITFHPVRPRGWLLSTPQGTVESDGSFRLTTFGVRQGAPAGEYAVTLSWRPDLVDADGVHAGPNLVPPRYADHATTPLRARIIEGRNHLREFEIPRECPWERVP